MLQEEENGLEEEEAEEGEDPGDLFNLDPGSKIIPSIGTKIRPTSVYVTRMSTVYTTVVSTELMLDWLESSRIDSILDSIRIPTRVFCRRIPLKNIKSAATLKKATYLGAADPRLHLPLSWQPSNKSPRRQWRVRATNINKSNQIWPPIMWDKQFQSEQKCDRALINV